MHTHMWHTHLGGTMVKNPPANVEDARDVDLIPGLSDPLEGEMATDSDVLGWKIPWTEEPDGLPSMELQRVTIEQLNTHMHAKY